MSSSVTNPADPSAPRWLADGVAADILAIIAAAGEPVGAGHVRTELAGRGHDLSASTTARRLRDLDARGLTCRVGAKGRELTEQGTAEVRNHRISSNGARLVAATEVHTAGDLLNLLRARRAIEPEAIRDATAHASAAHVGRLRSIIDEHQRRLQAGEPLPRDCALAFHREAALSARNPLVRAMLRLVLDENLDHVEATLDIILEAHHHSDRSVTEHDRIVDAMEAGEPARAGELMRAHLDRLLGEVEDFLARYDSDLVDRMLRQHH